eukprot:jgi/Tetstr1/433821/TSEL_023007.t1
MTLWASRSAAERVAGEGRQPLELLGRGGETHLGLGVLGILRLGGDYKAAWLAAAGLAGGLVLGRAAAEALLHGGLRRGGDGVLGLAVEKLFLESCLRRRTFVSVAGPHEASACILGERLVPRVRFARHFEAEVGEEVASVLVGGVGRCW